MSKLAYIALVGIYLSLLGCGGDSSIRTDQPLVNSGENNSSGNNSGGGQGTNDSGSGNEGTGNDGGNPSDTDEENTALSFSNRNWVNLGLLSEDTADVNPFMTLGKEYAFAFWFIERASKKTLDIATYKISDLIQQGPSSGDSVKNIQTEGYTPAFNGFTKIGHGSIDAFEKNGVVVWESENTSNERYISLSRISVDQSNNLNVDVYPAITQGSTTALTYLNTAIDSENRIFVVYRWGSENYYTGILAANDNVIQSEINIGNTLPSLKKTRSGDVVILTANNSQSESDVEFLLTMKILAYNNDSWESTVVEGGLLNYSSKVQTDIDIDKDFNALIAVTITDDVNVGQLFSYESIDNISWTRTDKVVRNLSSLIYSPIAGISSKTQKFILYAYDDVQGGLDDVMLARYSGLSWEDPDRLHIYGYDSPNLITDHYGNALIIYEDIDATRFHVINSNSGQQSYGTVKLYGHGNFRKHELIKNEDNVVFMLHRSKSSHGLYLYR
jgi:hypothetical protein